MRSSNQKNKNLDTLSEYIDEKVKQKDYKGAEKDALTFKENNMISPKHYNTFKTLLKNIMAVHNQLEKNNTQ